MLFLYQYAVATYTDTFFSNPWKHFTLVISIVFIALSLAVIAGAIAGIIFTLRAMDELSIPRIAYAVFQLFISVILLIYSVLALSLFRRKMGGNASLSLQRMMVIMIVAVCVMIASFSLQVAFQALNLESQPLRAPVWATVVLGKMTPEFLVSLALLAVIFSGIYAGMKRDKTEIRNSEESEEFVSETSQPLLANEKSVPKAYDY